MTKDRYLIRAADIEALPAQRKAHFLNHEADCENRALGDATGITGFGFHILDIPPGRDSTEPHFHYREDECIYILSGRGTALIGDEAFDVAAGDFLGYRKGGLAHGLRNDGEDVMRCIVVGERGDTDVVDYPNKSKRMFRTKGLDWNVVDLENIAPRAPRT